MILSKRKTAVIVVWCCVAFLVLLAGSIIIGNYENGAVVLAAKGEGEVGFIYIHIMRFF